MEKDRKVFCDLCSEEIQNDVKELYRFRNERWSVYFDICQECRDNGGN